MWDNFVVAGVGTVVFWNVLLCGMLHGYQCYEGSNASLCLQSRSVLKKKKKGSSSKVLVHFCQRKKHNITEDGKLQGVLFCNRQNNTGEGFLFKDLAFSLPFTNSNIWWRYATVWRTSIFPDGDTLNKCYKFQFGGKGNLLHSLKWDVTYNWHNIEYLKDINNILN